MKIKSVFIGLAFMMCAATAQAAEPAAPAAAEAPMKITTDAFAPEGTIPQKYTCDGANTAPALAWDNAPTNAKSFALIVEDPDAPAGVFTHWVIYNIPAQASALGSPLPETALQGKNSAGKTGFSGPCPPPGHGSHRYYFKLYALDSLLAIGADSADAAALKQAMKGHILASAELM